jgi:uncharacterized protein
MTAYAWAGTDSERFELAFVELDAERLTARGTQVGVDPTPYRLEYVLETAPGFASERLQASVETARGSRTLDLRRGRGLLDGDVLDLDLASSPLFNSLPVLRRGLHRGGSALELTAAFVDVPELEVSRSEQRYVPLEGGVVRFRSGSFSAELTFDEDGFVIEYPGLARRVP